MYDELVKRLRAVAGGGREEKCDGCPYEEDYPCCVDCLDKLHKQAADAIEGLQKPKWIPVTERLPEKRKWVLCRCQASITDVLRYENAEWYHDPTHVYMFDFVTHWMPLPEPPKEET